MESDTEKSKVYEWLKSYGWKLVCVSMVLIAGLAWIQYSITMEETTHSNIMRYHGCEEREITYSDLGFVGKTKCVSEPIRTEEEMELHSKVDMRYYSDRTFGILLIGLLAIYIYQKE